MIPIESVPLLNSYITTSTNLLETLNTSSAELGLTQNAGQLETNGKVQVD